MARKIVTQRKSSKKRPIQERVTISFSGIHIEFNDPRDHQSKVPGNSTCEKIMRHLDDIYNGHFNINFAGDNDTGIDVKGGCGITKEEWERDHIPAIKKIIELYT